MIYTVEVTNRFKGLDLVDRVPEELWIVFDIVQEAVIKTIHKKKKCKRAKWLSATSSQDEALARYSVSREVPCSALKGETASILWNSAFSWVYCSLSPLLFISLLSQLFVKPTQTTILPSCIYFSWG